MSGKINIGGILAAHFETLRDHAQNRISLIDVTVLFVCPAIVAVVVFVSEAKLTTVLVGSLINAAAILTGLLLNLLMLMFDQSNRVEERLVALESPTKCCQKVVVDHSGVRRVLELRSKLISETVANISFTTLFCIASLCSLLLFSAIEEPVYKLAERITYAVNAFIWINVVLTILMVMKRVFALFCSSAKG